MTDSLAAYYLQDSAGQPAMQDGCRILDAGRIPAQHPDAVNARRTQPVYSWQAERGDRITVNPGTANEQIIEAVGGETVFIKKVSDEGVPKIYIPSASSGPLDADTLDTKYEPATAYAPREPDAVIRQVPPGRAVSVRLPKRTLFVPFLHEAIDGPTIILNARGAGQHQKLAAGDSLKFEENQWLGVPKSETDYAWEVAQPGKKFARQL